MKGLGVTLANYVRRTAFIFHALCIALVLSQGTEIAFTIDVGAGLVYFLIVFFFSLNFGTPVVRWLYINYLSKWVAKAGKELSKVSRRFNERLSDAGRKVSQNIRVGK
mmetsp:Transcript_6363/g.14067  ORF Transcript_6363/g.14067 Transcript_6363/m.14067 type:complete len:108 (+) Transcript_6363:143-466(+)